MNNRPKVVLVGAGFAGLAVAQGLKKAEMDVLIIDQYNHHLLQPLLYQVATAALSPSEIATPIRWIVKNQKNASVLMAKVLRVIKDKKKIVLSDLEEIDYDYLILAPGNSPSYFGHSEWAKNAPELKTINNALFLREKILSAFERAERFTDPESALKELVFVIIGGRANKG